MSRGKKHGALSIRAAVSTAMMTRSPASLTTNIAETEADYEATKHLPFRFLNLPSELRNKIYSLLFCSAPAVIDLDPSTFSILNGQKLFSIFRVNRQLYHEATHYFFSSHTFRLFPTFPGRHFKTKRPILARLPKDYRTSLTSLDLRLGPGWNNPPRGWIVNEALGLADCRNVRLLKVFVESDPSDVIYKGFRAADGFYEHFCAALLEGVLTEVPSINVVEFDAYPGVKRTGDMMVGLGEVVTRYDKNVTWGPERGWAQETDCSTRNLNTDQVGLARRNLAPLQSRKAEQE